MKVESNEILDFALNHKFKPLEPEMGTEKVVAFGDHSHKCPVYVKRTPPCTASCPAGEDIRGYHDILTGADKVTFPGVDKFEAAFYKLVETNPFPSVMGRVCPAPCQNDKTGCNRNYLDETVGINAVEHAIGTYAIEKGFKLRKLSEEKTGKHIAIVGAGPAGLSAAYQLARRGHKVTMYDAFEKMGGMVRYAIMNYRVSREALDAEIQRIMDVGDITFKGSTKIGKDISMDELKSKHDSVFVGVGARNGRNLPIPGAEGTDGVTNAIDLLVDIEQTGNHKHLGKNVVVIGDGDVAMDAARISLRKGAKATLLSGVPREEMNCSPPEFEDAQIEGTNMMFLTGSIEVIKDGNKVKGLKVQKMQKKDKGEEGWNSPIPFLRYKPVPGSESVIECDTIVAAIGQTTDMKGFENLTNNTPFLKVDGNMRIQGMDNVFGGGDAVKITLITTAIGHGRKAAEAIHNYVMGKGLPTYPREDIIRFKELKADYFPLKPMAQRKHNHMKNVENNYQEILESLSMEDAAKESSRCMSCGLCFNCRQCMMYCPQEAITWFPKNPMGQVMFTYYDKCVGCHICAEVCPTGYIDMGMGDDL